MKKYFRMIAAVLICLVAVSVTDVKAASYSDADVYLLAQLVYHEAHNQAYNGKVGIAEVVLNRLNSSLFPNSVEAVIGQKGQFLSVSRLRGVKPTDQEIRIAENVLNGSLRVFDDPNVMYFRNPKITSGFSSKVEKNWGNLDYATAIGDHAFYSQDMKTLKIAAAAEKEDEISNKLPTSVVASMFSAEKKDVVEKAEVVEVIAQAVAEETVAEEITVIDENVVAEAASEMVAEVIVPEIEVPVADDALLAIDVDSIASNEELLALTQTMQVQLSLEDTLANEIETAVEVEAESEDDVTEVDAAATDETDTDVDTDVDEDLVADVVALAVDTDVTLTEMVMPTDALQMAASKVTDSEDADSEDADSDNEDDEDDEDEDDEDEEIDENDPVARVHRQLKRDAKLKRKQDAKRAAEYTQAINAAHDLAVVNTKAAVERVENVLKAGQPLNIKTLAN